MKKLGPILLLVAGMVAWRLYNKPLSEGDRLLAEAEARIAANEAEAKARAALFQNLKPAATPEPTAGAPTEERTLAQDDAEMARERLRSWQEKTDGNSAAAQKINTLAEDDAEMARERLRSWQEKTSPRP